jgi:glucose-1-phosphate thymidylyltransferase
MKGVVLAGGSGSRLYPITKGVSKQLLPVYDKPMVYYPISVLMLAGIRHILIITTPDDAPAFHRLLGDGSDLGIHLHYATQPSPDGLAQALIIAKDFVDNDSLCLVLGDNIFYGQAFSDMLRHAVHRATHLNQATIFGYYVPDPQRYGVAEIDQHGALLSIQEKPTHPKSNYAVTGLYFYPNRAIHFASTISPSPRGELEITAVNQCFLDEHTLHLQRLGRGFTWLDTGTHDSLSEASTFVETIQKRQGLKIACLEEIAFAHGWLQPTHLRTIAASMASNQYGQYLLSLLTPTPSSPTPPSPPSSAHPLPSPSPTSLFLLLLFYIF